MNVIRMLLTSLALFTLVQAAELPEPVLEPVKRQDANSVAGHEDLLKKAKSGKIDVYFLGDSITRRWGALDYPRFLENWQKTFYGWNAANFGWGGDSVENMLWRIENGEMEGLSPKVIAILAGTNNLRAGFTAADADLLAKKIEALVLRCREKAPKATLILTGIFPRNDLPGIVPIIRRINEQLAAFAQENGIHFVDISDRLALPDGTLREGMSSDKLHLELPGYEIWGQALAPIIERAVGPRAKNDEAPPPTGDPKAMKAKQAQ